MWFNVLMLLMFLGVWYFQITQGAYSALIMLILSVLSVIVTFETYEFVAAQVAPWIGNFAGGSAFMFLFAVALAVLRFTYDNIAPANIYFMVLIDRALAAFFGLFTGLILSGMVAIGFQMLPMGVDILGYDTVGVVAEPREDTKEANRTNINVWKFISHAMEFSPDYAAGLSRKLWFGQDVFAFGVYKAYANRAGVRLPNDHYGEEMGSEEFFARCWDARVQARFNLTPVALRVPLGSVNDDGARREPRGDPIRVERMQKFTEQTYQKIASTVGYDHVHVFVTVEFPFDSGIPGWYLQPAGTGNGVRRHQWPFVLPAGTDKYLKDDPEPRFASFSYWQMRLLCEDNGFKQAQEFPLRGVYGMNITQQVDASGNKTGSGSGGRSSRKELREDFVNLIKNSRPDNPPSGNIAVMRFAALEKGDATNKTARTSKAPLRFRLMFFVPKAAAEKGMRLIYTGIPPDTRLLGVESERQKYEFVSRSFRASPVVDPLNQLNDTRVSE